MQLMLCTCCRAHACLVLRTVYEKKYIKQLNDTIHGRGGGPGYSGLGLGLGISRILDFGLILAISPAFLGAVPRHTSRHGMICLVPTLVDLMSRAMH